MHTNKPKNSEVDAYTYIKEELEKLGWIVKNPARVIDGEVYKQNEVLAHNEIKKFLNRDMPEAVIKLNESEFWIIESKREKKEMNNALDEAINQYAKKINQSKNLKCILISGVAGNDSDGFNVENKYFKNGKWETVLFNGRTKNTLLSKEQAKYIIKNKTINYKEFPDFPEKKYLSSAEKINDILHNAGINKNKRARFIAGLVLSLSSEEDINTKTTDTTVLVENINSIIKRKLREVKKENFINFLDLELPPSAENHVKYRQAIIETLRELQTLDIKNAMASGNDILGKFYEKFLKYGNGAKEIGIVLTPRHITRFAAEILNIKYNDYILDPACGTGGFLVSAFDYVKNNTKDDKQINEFKNYHIFGIEQDDEVVALALVNMIFRGDGKNNIRDGNCFQHNVEKAIKNNIITGEYWKKEGKLTENPIITKVLMNPPFALKKGDEKEYNFIDYALSQMQDGGFLFAIIPSPIMFKSQKAKAWRKEMLKNNTLKAVIKLPEDLFYPVGVHTSIIIIQKGSEHDFKEDVFWGKIDDGYTKKKGVMIKKNNGNLDLIKEVLRNFINGGKIFEKNSPKNYSFEKILNDSDLECAPEYYLKETTHKEEEIVNEMRYNLTKIFIFLLNNPYLNNIKVDININNDYKIKNNDKIDDLFFIENAKSKNIEDYGLGDIPFVTSTTSNNGVEKYIDEDDPKLIYKKPCITLSSFGQANIQITPFVARSHGAVLVLMPKQSMSLKQLLYYTAQINFHNWRFSYGRWVTKKRLLKLEINNMNDFKLPSFKNIYKSLGGNLNKINDILA